MNETPRIKIQTVGKFLIGDREAILTIASGRGVIFLAFLLIVSAGLARNYDHHLLLKEPLWIGGPLAMSLFSALFIFPFVKMFGRLKSGDSNFTAFFRCFLMTAPLAWFYGFPIERFAGPLPSTVFNFGVLMIVSFWRLGLMIRVISVLYGFTLGRAFVAIALPASMEMFVATLFKGMNIVGIMGGMRLSEADLFLLNATSGVTMGSVVLFVVAIVVGFASKPGNVRSWETQEPERKISGRTWLAAFGVIFTWLTVAINPQRKLTTQDEFHRLIRGERYEDAAAFLKERTARDFPEHQEFIPGKSYWRRAPMAMDLLVYHDDWPVWFREMLIADVKSWIADKPERSNSQNHFENLYSDFRDAPYVQKIADELTPGVRAADYFKEDAPPEEVREPSE